MTQKLIRLALVALAVLAGSIALPEFYYESLRQDRPWVSLDYSETLRDFVVSRQSYDETTETNSAEIRAVGTGKSYTEEEADALFPVKNLRQLEADDRVPTEINGEPVTPALLRTHSFGQRSPLQVSFRAQSELPYGFGVLFEGKPPFGTLETPPDNFRCTDQGIDFLRAEANTWDVDKGTRFTTALKEKGFAFPPRIVQTSGQPGDRIYNGIFMVDAKGQLFQMSMENGQPVVRQISLPQGFQLQGFSRVSPDLGFWAFVTTPDAQVYRMMTEDFSLRRVPIELPKDHRGNLSVQGDYCKITITGGRRNTQIMYVLDRDWNYVSQYSMDEAIAPTKAEQFAPYLFPFESHAEMAFDITFKNFPKAIWLNLVLMLALIPWKWKTHARLTSWSAILDYAVTAFAGVFGFLGVLIFPNRH